MEQVGTGSALKLDDIVTGVITDNQSVVAGASGGIVAILVV
jgi:hypothetical protein